MLQFIYDIPVLYKVIFSLLAILVLSRFFKTVFIPICVGTAIIACSLGYSANEVTAIFAHSTLNINTIFLFIVFFEIECLSLQMSESGTLKKIVHIVKSHLNKKKAMAVLPALIGFLPMPGGALFSAPLVDDCDESRENDPILKAKINYWFRHIWEYWWPLFPGVLLAIELSKLETWQFMLIQLPMSIFSVAVGYYFLLRKVRGEISKSPVKFDAGTVFSIFRLSLPVLIVMIVYGAIKITVPGISAINKYFPMAIGILTGIMILQAQSPLNLRQWKKIILSKSIYSMLLLVYAVVLYGSIIEGKLPDGTPVVGKIGIEIAAVGIPQTALLIIIPFICGMSTGVAIAFVGASFPIVMSLLGENPTIGTLLCSTFLAYGSGYVGMILSPVHVCLIVTNEHFNTQLAESLRRLALPAFVLLSLNFLLFLVMRFILC